MESTGMRGKIHVSQDTADRLINAGKTNWITPREDKVFAKGKGEMQTFWVMAQETKANTATDQTETSRGTFTEDIFETPSVLPSADPYAKAKEERLVKWNVEVLMNLLKQIKAHRSMSATTNQDPCTSFAESFHEEGQTVVDEVQEIVRLRGFDGHVITDYNSVRLSTLVTKELKSYVATVAALYRDNPFHNFEVRTQWYQCQKYAFLDTTAKKSHSIFSHTYPPFCSHSMHHMWHSL
jgi:hypothetical protein